MNATTLLLFHLTLAVTAQAQATDPATSTPDLAPPTDYEPTTQGPVLDQDAPPPLLNTTASPSTTLPSTTGVTSASDEWKRMSRGYRAYVLATGAARAAASPDNLSEESGKPSANSAAATGNAGLGLTVETDPNEEGLAWQTRMVLNLGLTPTVTALDKSNKSEFGHAILDPGTGAGTGQLSGTLGYNVKLDDDGEQSLYFMPGFLTRNSGSLGFWSIQSTKPGANGESALVTKETDAVGVFASDLLATLRLHGEGRMRWFGEIGAGATVRGIGGDVELPIGFTVPHLRDYIGTRDWMYGGVALRAAVGFQGVELSTEVTWMPPKPAIAGLTGGQALFGLTYRGEVMDLLRGKSTDSARDALTGGRTEKSHAIF